MLSVLYQDTTIVAINKPAGLLVHKSDIDKYDTLSAQLLLQEQLKQLVYPLHRLDKPTSGILLFALTPAIIPTFQQGFLTQQVIKKYLALVRGYTKEEGTIDYPLAKLNHYKGSRKITTAPQEAITQYKRLGTVELPFAVGKYPTARYSLLEVQPVTGRNRQIRRHLKHIFHPIVGDTAHGDGKHNRFFREQFSCHRLLLHAHQLSFRHPVSGVTISLKAPLEATFRKILQQFSILDSY
ncbi:MAG: pseudouridine synthase [Thermonemataceae bacterium]